MKLKKIQAQFHNELDTIYGTDEVNSFFYLLIEFYFELSRLQLALNPEFAISTEQQSLILSALSRLKKEEPIQYIIGKTEFYGLPFYVSDKTLIPRPETEELVDWIIKHYPNEASLKILDIGTGTGCIAIALAKHFPNAIVSAMDVSSEALLVANKNAELNQVEINFIEKDIFSIKHIMLSHKNDIFDVIVSNPPYVRQLEKEQMKPNVLEHEPHLALFVDDKDPLIFYKAITQFAVNNLRKKGSLFFEINEYLGDEMAMLLKTNYFNNIELKKDFFGKDRMIKGIKDI